MRYVTNSRCRVCNVPLVYAGKGRPRTYCHEHRAEGHRQANSRYYAKSRRELRPNPFKDDGARIDAAEAILSLTTAAAELERRVRVRPGGDRPPDADLKDLFDTVWGALSSLDNACGAELHPSQFRRLGG